MEGMMTHTKIGSKFTDLILEIFRFNGLLIEAGDKLIGDLGLSSARWQILGSLVNEPLSVVDIARQMGLSRQNVQRIANRLEKDGFVHTSPNPAHRRSKLYLLTPLGSETMQEVAKRQEIWANRLAQNIDLSELTKTLSMMIDCRSRVQKSMEVMGDDNDD